MVKKQVECAVSDTSKVKHTAGFHLKQMDKIAKSGEVPDAYKKLFKGVKDPRAHIRAVDREIKAIREREHKQHQRDGIKVSAYCEVCKASNGGVEIIPEPAEESESEEYQLTRAGNAEKSGKATPVEEPAQVEPEIAIREKDGTTKKMSLAQLKEMSQGKAGKKQRTLDDLKR